MKRTLFLLSLLGLLMSMSMLLTIPAAGQDTVPNDTLAGAIAVNTFPYTNSQNTIGATDTTDDTDLFNCGFNILNTVWYTFTPATDGWLSVDAFGSNYSVTVQLTGAEPQCSNFSSGTEQGYISWAATGGQSYTVAFGGNNDQTGQLQVNADLTPITTPANDTPANAVAVTSFPFTDTVFNIDATDTTDEPSPAACDFVPDGNTVWYDITPATSGVIHVNTIGSDFNTFLYVVAPELCNDDGYDLEPPLDDNGSLSKLNWNATADTTYRVGVGGLSALDFGILTFNAYLYEPTSNDTPATATQITSLPFSTEQIVFEAADATGEFAFECGDDGEQKVWFELNAPADGYVFATTLGSEYDTSLAIAGTPQICNDDAYYPAPGHWNYYVSTAQIEVTQGETYLFGVSGYDDSNFGVLRFAMSYVDAPANDTPDTAEWFYNEPYVNGEVNVQTIEGSNIGALNTTGDDQIPCDFNQEVEAPDDSAYWVWYNIWVPLSGSILLDGYYETEDTAPEFTTTYINMWVVGEESCASSPSISVEGGSIIQVAVGGDGFAAGPFKVTLEYIPDENGTPARVYPSTTQEITDVSTGWPQFTFLHQEGVEWYQMWIGPEDYSSAALFEWYPAFDTSTSASEGQGICDSVSGECTIPTDIWLTNGNYRWWMTFWSPDSSSYDLYWNETAFSVNAGDLQTIANRAPSGGDVLNTAPTALTWDDDPNALWYQVWLGSADYSDTVQIGWYEAEEICELGACTLPIEGTLATGDFSWFIEVWGPSGYDTWSTNGNDEALFTVSEGAAVPRSLR